LKLTSEIENILSLSDCQCCSDFCHPPLFNRLQSCLFEVFTYSRVFSECSLIVRIWLLLERFRIYIHSCSLRKAFHFFTITGNHSRGCSSLSLIVFEHMKMLRDRIMISDDTTVSKNAFFTVFQHPYTMLTAHLSLLFILLLRSVATLCQLHQIHCFEVEQYAKPPLAANCRAAIDLLSSGKYGIDSTHLRLLKRP